MRLRPRLPLVSLAAILVWATVSLAFEEVPAWNQMEIPRPGWQDEGLWIGPTAEQGMAKTSPVDVMTARYGGNWRYNRNTLTGSLHRVYGSGFSFTGAIGSEEAARAAALDFIGANPDLFGMSGSDIRVAEIRNGAGKWVAHFDQTVNGIRVVGGRAHVVLTESGRLFAFGSDAYPNIAGSLSSTTPSISEAEAIAIAGRDIGYVDGTDEITYKELVILPTREGRGEGLALTYRLAWRLDLFAQSPYGHWETYVDAHTGEIVWRRSLIHPVDFTGHAQGDVEYASYCDGYTLDFPMDGMVIDISGVGTTYCDELGDFTLSYGGTSPATITSEFRGQWINVNRYTGTDASHTGTITPGTPYTIDWSIANSIDSERDCFSYLNLEHRWLKRLDPSFTGLDYEMPCSVERTDGYCPRNAWYDYYGINFCAPGSGYANTGAHVGRALSRVRPRHHRPALRPERSGRRSPRGELGRRRELPLPREHHRAGVLPEQLHVGDPELEQQHDLPRRSLR